jgi:choline dehydrogenase-like flavoprotein
VPGFGIPDVVVIGCGGGGAVIAKELAEAGLGVVVLEAGPWHQPARDFSGLEWDMLGGLDSVFRWGPADRNLPPWPRAREGVQALFQTAGVGGNTLHFGGQYPRAFPAAVELEWPFSYGELVPYYEKVEATLPVRTPDVLAPKDELFVRSCDKLGLENLAGPDVTGAGWRIQPNAILPIAPYSDGPLSYPMTKGCTQCGECIVGCRHPAGGPTERMAKRGTNVTYAPMAVHTGRCEIRTDCFVTAILTEDRRGVIQPRAVRYRSADGRVLEQDANIVVLAGGAVESPRLWLASGLPRGRAAGRYLTTHWLDYVAGEFDFEVDMFLGQTSMARADFPGYGFIETQGLGPLGFGFVAFLGRWGGAVAEGDPWTSRGRVLGVELKRRMEAYRRTLMLVTVVDDEAVPSNRVGLVEGRRDEHNEIPLIRYHPNDTTTARREWLVRKACEILSAAGARSIHRADALPSTVHQMGTMRMGTDPLDSVVDDACEAHLVKRLFIADTSPFPNGIGGPNPTLTAQALATRTAEKILERYFGGTEAEVSRV